MSESQDAVLEFLGRPQAHDGRAVRRIDTHASIIFLAGQLALKVKRDIRLPYLDYSTLEKRHAACEREFALNQPHAPQIYRRVVAVTQGAAGEFEIGGNDKPVEWLLEMARFDDRRTLDRVAQAGEIGDGVAGELADAILRSHTQAERFTGPAWVASLPKLVALNTNKFRAAAKFPIEDVARLDEVSLKAIERLHDSLARRTAGGFVRRCHGDLHLANVALIDGHPVLFDAIEFNDNIATTDIIYDLAFPIMDLLRFGKTAEANVVLNRYLSSAEAENLDTLAVLPLFLSLRAAIRAQVLLTGYEQRPADEMLMRARVYFDLACHLIAPVKPMLVAVGGLSGTGKSALSRRLAGGIAPQPGAVVLRSDVIRKRMFGVRETEPLPQSAYRPEVSVDVYCALVETASRILAQGISVIADAAWLRPDERHSIRQVARSRGVSFHGLFLTVDLSTRLARIAARRNDASDATAEVARQQEQYELGSIDWRLIDTEGGFDDTLTAARRCLAIDAQQQE